MQTYDRQGVHIEQCSGCGGIFLDRGELEQIMFAEQQHYGPPPAYGHDDSPPHYRKHQDSPPPHYPGHGGHYKDSPPPYGHRKRGFLEGLFD